MTNKEQEQIKYLIKRYKQFISNIDFNIKQIEPSHDYHKRGLTQKEIYKEVIKDLESLIKPKSAPINSPLK